jgi:hypothetical protein
VATKSNVLPLDLSTQTYRKDRPAARANGADVIVSMNGNDSNVEFDQVSNTTQISLPDGSVSISLGPPEPPKKKTKGFDENLAESLTESELSVICEKLLLGIENDSQSRAAWLENMSNGISLLGLETKQPRGATVAGATPAEGRLNRRSSTITRSRTTIPSQCAW